MNFLSHIAVVEPVGDRLVFAGAVLPDLLRHVGTGHHKMPAEGRAPSEDVARVMQGIRYHVEADAFFHYCPWFAATLKEVQAFMREEGNPLAEHWSRWLLPHLLIEIVIDAHLADIRPDLPKLLYGSLQEFAERDCCEAIAAQYKAKPSALRDIIGILRRNRRPETYRSVPGVADAMRRVLARDGREVLPVEDEHHLTAPLHWLKQRVGAPPDIIQVVREGIGL